MPFVIQSAATGAFLAPNPDDGQPEWVMLLVEAWLMPDFEQCYQTIADHIDPESAPVVVDLSRLGGCDAVRI